MKNRITPIKLLAVMASCCILPLGGCATSETLRDYYDSLSVDDPDLSIVEDGKYSGEYTLDPPFGVYVAKNRVELKVVIANHSYKDIIVTTESLKSHDHIKKMRKLILERQTLQIDAMTGATSLTGKAYINAIVDALE